MTQYTATLSRIINGCTIELNVQINPSQNIKRIIRLKGVISANVQKVYHSSFIGGSRLVEKFNVNKWFNEKGNNVIVEFYDIDICGRWLGEIWEDLLDPSLNDYLIDLFYYDRRWDIEEQENLKNDWFSGEVVTIPDGDKLPIFHIWGKSVFIGMESMNLELLE